MKPQWKHDCDQCTYLGSVHMHNTVADWYECSRTVLARLSDEGSDYLSMPKDMVLDGDRYLKSTGVNGTVAYSGSWVMARFMLEQQKHKKEQT